MNLEQKSVWIFTCLVLLLFWVAMFATPFSILVTSLAIGAGVLFQVFIILKDDANT